MLGLLWYIVNIVIDLFLSSVDFGEINTSTADLSFSINSQLLGYVLYIVKGSLIETVITIEIVWQTFKVGLAIFLRIKSFIPTISGT